MAVLPMSKVNIIGLKSDRKKILESIQKLGVVDVRSFETVTDGFTSIETVTSRSKFQKVRTNSEQALLVLERYSPEEKSLFASFEGKKSVSEDDYDRFISQREFVTNVANSVLNLEKEISEKKAQIIKFISSIETLKPWESLDAPMNTKGTRRTTVLFGVFADKYSKESLVNKFNEICEKKDFSELKDNVYIDIVSSGDSQSCVSVMCKSDQAKNVEEALRYMGFAAPPNGCNKIPADEIKELNSKIKEAEARIAECEDEIRKNSKHREALKFLVDYYAARIEKYEVIEKLGSSNSVFVLNGFVPTKDVEKLEKEVTEKWGGAFEARDATDEDNPPVLLKNNGFAAPLESVLETFTLPGKGEIDPTAAMAVFYYFLFGLMLSDAAYGLLMVLICSIALFKFPKMNEGLKKSLKMYLYCGISTVFWGVMFGGYFGDAITVISTTFFGKTVEIKPLWFAPMNEPMRMLIFSLLVGIIHLFAGLGMKLYSLIKSKNWKDAIYDVIFWYLLVGGAIVFLLTTKMFVEMAGLTFILPASVAKIATVCMIVGAVGITFTAGRSSKNPFKRFAKGLYELYGVTSYLSDILSYSRLLALGLATGVIANVFNKMGSMFGGGVFGAIAFSIVFVIGHTLNIGINLLGAYVHTNRLQFVEFFGKFYDGGGEKYKPFESKTKYYDIENN